MIPGRRVSRRSGALRRKPKVEIGHVGATGFTRVPRPSLSFMHAMGRGHTPRAMIALHSILRLTLAAKSCRSASKARHHPPWCQSGPSLQEFSLRIRLGRKGINSSYLQVVLMCIHDSRQAPRAFDVSLDIREPRRPRPRPKPQNPPGLRVGTPIFGARG